VCIIYLIQIEEPVKVVMTCADKDDDDRVLRKCMSLEVEGARGCQG